MMVDGVSGGEGVKVCDVDTDIHSGRHSPPPARPQPWTRLGFTTQCVQPYKTPNYTGGLAKSYQTAYIKRYRQVSLVENTKLWKIAISFFQG